MKPWLVSLVLVLAACTNRNVDSKSHEAATSITTIGPSIYPLAVTLHNQRGDTVALDVFRGHPVVISMFYGRARSLAR